jgi:hypothetical protein
MATAAKVFALFGPVTRRSCQIAISEAVYSIENNARDADGQRMTPARIAAEIDRSTETIENAKYQKTLVEFDTVARIIARWPEHCQDILNLWEMQPREPETTAEKRRRLIRELAALEDDC